jgi:hypothetical protein
LLKLFFCPRPMDAKMTLLPRNFFKKYFPVRKLY